MASKLMIVMALVCVLPAIIYAAPADDVDCTKFLEVAEDMGPAQGLSYVNDKHVRPVTKEELEKRCPEMESALKTLRKYNQKCMTSLTQQVASAVYKSRAAYNEQLCGKGNPEEVQKKLDTIKCFKENPAVEAKIKSAEERVALVSQVLHESDIKDDKERLKRACCTVLEFKEDLANAIKPACEKHTSTFNEYIDSYTSESMGIICPDADKLSKDGECSKLAPLKTDGVKSKYGFFLIPVFKVVKTLDHN